MYDDDDEDDEDDDGVCKNKTRKAVWKK